MEIADSQAAEFYLQHYNYYRLGAYWLPFEEDHGAHRFKPGTKLDDVLTLYTFDRELRLLVMDAIERVEVSVRAQWAYQMGHCHGPHSHLASGIARNKYHWQRNIEDLTKEVERSEEIFIQHITATYKEKLPPTWAACEVMSLGLLSRWYTNLSPISTRQKIAKAYEIDDKVLQSWLHHLSIVRNICAHHSRLWDRSFSIQVATPKSKPVHLAGEFLHSKRLYNTFVMLIHLMDIIAPHSDWHSRIMSLLATPNIQLSLMGFPENWETRPIWQEKGTK